MNKLPNHPQIVTTFKNGKTIKIYSGVNVSVNTGNNVWAAHRIVFPEPFTNVPFINVMEYQTASGQAASENIAIENNSITTTGFTYYVHTPATGFEYGTYWQAIGY